MAQRLIIRLAGPLAILASVSACTNPYDPGQRALGGGLIGAGTGAALGSLAGGGRGALIGALAGGAVGSVAGAATTPQPAYGYGAPYGYAPPPAYYAPAPGYYAPAYGY